MNHPNIFDIPDILPIARHAWLMLVIITFANAAIWRNRGRIEIARNPALEAGYRRLISRFLIYGNIPWLILGAAMELPRMFRGPLLIVFAITVCIYWVAGFYWLAFRGGAEELAAHPGGWRGDVRDPWIMKMQVLILTGVTLAGMLLLAF